MPSLIQIALVLESAANILGATAFTFYPNYLLSNGLSTITPSKLSTIVPASSETLLAALGTIVYALTVPLLLSLPDGPHAAAKRAITYQTLLAGELFLTPLMLVKGLNEGGGGFGRTTMLVGAGNLAAITIWRLYALYVKPEILASQNAIEARKRQ
ncbi:hypothetical protein EJ08DRAFT_649125 [Tothia fuscella]|uniref:Uncharacterized protein n=1 Tax=Tothia fuscella TaxID=1048955 RepID=A0A9P4TZL0_9PEZI|nr:hypothetical protein EJ08DRAFT_649125 [Tothia fuscella]